MFSQQNSVLLWQVEEAEGSPEIPSQIASDKKFVASLLASGVAGLGAGAAVAGDSFSVKVEDVEEGAAHPTSPCCLEDLIVALSVFCEVW